MLMKESQFLLSTQKVFSWSKINLYENFMLGINILNKIAYSAWFVYCHQIFLGENKYGPF